MGEWWYGVGSQRSGPTDEAGLKRLLQDGTVSPGTLVWREGFDSWVTLRSVESLSHLLKTVPLPLPSGTGGTASTPEAGIAQTPDATGPKAAATATSVPVAPRPAPVRPTVSPARGTAWRRCLARLLDVWIAGLLLLILVAAARLSWPPAFAWLSARPSVLYLFTFGMLPLALVLDAVIRALFGNTAGKALLRVEVVTVDGRPLRFPQYLACNLSLWGYGFALGLPLFGLLTMAYQGWHVRAGREANYDVGRFQVRQRDPGWLRPCIFMLVFVALLLTNTLSSIVVEKIMRLEAAARNAQPPGADEGAAQAPVAPSTSTAPATTAAPPPLKVATGTSCADHFYRGAAPTVTNAKLGQGTRLLCLQGMALTYSAVTRTGLWSAEHITAAKLAKAGALDFNPELHLEMGLSENERSTFEDFDFDSHSAVPLTPPTRLATAVARIESATLANTVPLVDSALALRWSDASERVATRAAAGGDVYAVSGALFEGATLVRLNDRILVPSALYIAYFDEGDNTAHAYILANSKGAKVKPIDVAALERRAGIRFFPARPAAVPAADSAASAPAGVSTSKPNAKAVAKPGDRAAVADFTSCAKPQQPLESKRNEEEGESQIALLVDVNGAVLDSRVKKSSGFPQLDAAARDAIGLCRFSPAVRDGEPTRSWATVRYVWSRD